MKSKPKTKLRNGTQAQLLVRVFNPRYITFSSKHDPLINRYVRRIMGLSS
jgi:hypothetical protein